MAPSLLPLVLSLPFLPTLGRSGCEFLRCGHFTHPGTPGASTYSWSLHRWHIHFASELEEAG